MLNEEGGSEQCGSIRRNRFEPLNDTTGLPKRVFRKTPPPRRRFYSATSINEEGASESRDFSRRPSFEKLERPRSDSSQGSECFWPTLPEWPELDSAAFERGKALLGSMEMDPADFSRDDLCHLALELFQSAGLPEVLSADLGRVRRFILAVRESMYDNAYHNFYHVFDVTQTVSVIARRTGTLDRLDAWERFALLAAAFCHGASLPPPPPALNHPLLRTQYLYNVLPTLPRCSLCARVCLAEGTLNPNPYTLKQTSSTPASPTSS